MQSFTTNDLTFTPVTDQEWQDFQELFSETGVQSGCWCMYWRIKRVEFFKNYGESNRQAMKGIIESGNVPGILAYLHGQPIGWCSIAPREQFPVLDRSPTLKRIDDQPVWSMVCFFVSKPYRNQGVSKALIEAAINYARKNGATIIEAYPLVLDDSSDDKYEHYMGFIPTFLAAGFQPALQRSERRLIMRLSLTPHPPANNKT